MRGRQGLERNLVFERIGRDKFGNTPIYAGEIVREKTEQIGSGRRRLAHIRDGIRVLLESRTGDRFQVRFRSQTSDDSGLGHRFQFGVRSPFLRKLWKFLMESRRISRGTIGPERTMGLMEALDGQPLLFLPIGLPVRAGTKLPMRDLAIERQSALAIETPGVIRP